jgi:hypothetical protein
VLVDVNRTIAQATNTLSLAQNVQCFVGASSNNDLVIKPRASLNIAVKAPVTIKLDWFGANSAASYAIDIKESGTYIVKNPIQVVSNDVTVSSNSQSISVCKQS